jgi:hypothetical protein
MHISEENALKSSTTPCNVLNVKNIADYKKIGG